MSRVHLHVTGVLQDISPAVGRGREALARAARRREYEFFVPGRVDELLDSSAKGGAGSPSFAWYWFPELNKHQRDASVGVAEIPEGGFWELADATCGVWLTCGVGLPGCEICLWLGVQALVAAGSGWPGPQFLLNVIGDRLIAGHCVNPTGGKSMDHGSALVCRPSPIGRRATVGGRCHMERGGGEEGQRGRAASRSRRGVPGK